MCLPPEGRDRAGNEKGVPQIEVTPEMILAGVDALEDIAGIYLHDRTRFDKMSAICVGVFKAITMTKKHP